MNYCQTQHDFFFLTKIRFLILNIWYLFNVNKLWVYEICKWFNSNTIYILQWVIIFIFSFRIVDIYFNSYFLPSVVVSVPRGWFLALWSMFQAKTCQIKMKRHPSVMPQNNSSGSVNSIKPSDTNLSGTRWDRR